MAARVSNLQLYYLFEQHLYVVIRFTTVAKEMTSFCNNYTGEIKNGTPYLVIKCKIYTLYMDKFDERRVPIHNIITLT